MFCPEVHDGVNCVEACVSGNCPRDFIKGICKSLNCHLLTPAYTGSIRAKFECNLYFRSPTACNNFTVSYNTFHYSKGIVNCTVNIVDNMFGFTADDN